MTASGGFEYNSLEINNESISNADLFDIPEPDLSNYSYQLPKERIALHPAHERQASRLLAANAENGEILDDVFENIIKYLPENSLICLNRTKVIPARIIMEKPSGGKVEVFCIEPISPSKDPQKVFSSAEPSVWKCMIGGRKVHAGMTLIAELNNNSENALFSAKILNKEKNFADVEFSCQGGNLSFGTAISLAGKIPLPPYIKRETDETDIYRYQTVYAKEQGSVAAPTAGLHFTDEIISSLKTKHINTCEFVLHVGPGTFKPIDTEKVHDFHMHKERIFISLTSLELLEKSLKESRTIVAVGTTSVRTLESIYWLALMLNEDSSVIKNGEFEVEQWEAYRRRKSYPTTQEAVSFLIGFMKKNNFDELSGLTGILILPGYKFRLVQAMITNFHIPESTLLLLVSAFVGREFWKKIYDHALENDYRFLSYGDSSFLLPLKEATSR